jgi:ADP-ribosylglycohydrolase
MRDADSGGWPRRLNMIGAIAGDIIGSVFEHNPIKTTTFPLFSQPSCFTDDTVLSVAVADAILNRTDYATALAIFLARQAAEKSDIRREIRNRFHYPLDRSLAEIRPHYTFDISCQGSAPESIMAFLESQNFENAIRLAVSLGGDSDTMACIAGGIAQAYYGQIPNDIIDQVRRRLPEALLHIIDQFNSTYAIRF